MSRSWFAIGQDGLENSLKYKENVKVSSAAELGPNEVLVKMYSASIAYRDIHILQGVIKIYTSRRGPSYSLTDYRVPYLDG